MIIHWLGHGYWRLSHSFKFRHNQLLLTMTFQTSNLEDRLVYQYARKKQYKRMRWLGLSSGKELNWLINTGNNFFFNQSEFALDISRKRILAVSFRIKKYPVFSKDIPVGLQLFLEQREYFRRKGSIIIL